MGKRRNRKKKKGIWQHLPWNQYMQTHLCTHWRNPVKVGEYTVLASGFHDRPHEPMRHPGAGVYLDTQWAQLQGDVLAAPGTPGMRGNYPALYARWFDGGAFSLSSTRRMVEWCKARLEEGLSVEIGCAGGHGRTGTFIACLISDVENIGAEESIRAIRDRLCADCVETVKQEAMVYEYCGEDPPETPQIESGTVWTPGQHPQWQGNESVPLHRQTVGKWTDTGQKPDKESDDPDTDVMRQALCGEAHCTPNCIHASTQSFGGNVYCSYLGSYVRTTEDE